MRLQTCFQQKEIMSQIEELLEKGLIEQNTIPVRHLFVLIYNSVVGAEKGCMLMAYVH